VPITRRALRTLLWLAVGALLLFRAGTSVTTSTGSAIFGPAVFSAAAVAWLFITIRIALRRLSRRHG
jgi:hypothetical protein